MIKQLSAEVQKCALIGSIIWIVALAFGALVTRDEVRSGRGFPPVAVILLGVVGSGAVSFSFAAAMPFVTKIVNALTSSGSGHIEDPSWYHGTARFSTEQEIKSLTMAAGRTLPPGAFYLGSSPSGPIVLPRSLSVQHGFILGGSGTGKSRGFFMSTGNHGY